MRKMFKLGLLMVLATAVVFASLGSALAQGPPATPPGSSHRPELTVKGTVTAKTASTVTITPKEGSAVTVKIEASTRITKADIGGSATLGNVAIGDRAVAVYNKDTLVALKLSISPPAGKHHGYKGTIKTILASGFVLTSKKDGDVTFKANPDTRYKVPGVKDATLANFIAGNQVAVEAVEVSGANVALHVQLIPGKPASIHRHGTIQAYTAATAVLAGSITLKDKKGELSTFVVTTDSKIELKKDATGVTLGSRATVVARRDPTTNVFTAKAIVVFGP